MDNNVIISIKGMQSLDGAENETVELVTEGTLIRDGDGEYTISYQESEVTGMEGTLTTFQIERGRVTLLRIGEFNSQMVFEQGRRHLSMYDTPYGALSVGVNTRRMRCRIRAPFLVFLRCAATGFFFLAFCAVLRPRVAGRSAVARCAVRAGFLRSGASKRLVSSCCAGGDAASSR